MFTFITILIVIVCGLLTLAVLVQNSKGGGLAAGFSSSAQVMGVRKTSDFLEKLTWGLASALLILCLVSNFAIPSGKKQDSSILKDEINNMQAPVQSTGPAPIGGGISGKEQGTSKAPSSAPTAAPSKSPAPAIAPAPKK